MTIPTQDKFGPWRPGLDLAELLTPLRSMRALVLILTNRRGAEFVSHLSYFNRCSINSSKIKYL